MDAIVQHLPEGFLDFVLNLFEAVPVGFLLAMFCGLASFGIFALLGLFRKLVSSR